MKLTILTAGVHTRRQISDELPIEFSPHEPPIQPLVIDAADDRLQSPGDRR
jgi:hypothetical protein